MWFSPPITKTNSNSNAIFTYLYFFLLYDIELVFLFPYISGVAFAGFFDFILLILFFLLFIISIIIDYERHALYWQY